MFLFLTGPVKILPCLIKPKMTPLENEGVKYYLVKTNGENYYMNYEINSFLLRIKSKGKSLLVIPILDLTLNLFINQIIMNRYN